MTTTTKVIAFVCGHFEVNGKQSMTRAITLILALASVIPAAAGYRVATRAHLDGSAAVVITALTGMVGAFVAAGCVALAKRTKPGELPVEPSTPTGPANG